MTRTRDLELALQARWDLATLLVYADALQAAGDPRGELIALDVEIATHGITPELARRRRRRLYEWLGGGAIAGRPIHEAAIRDGFVTDFLVTRDRRAGVAAYLEALFASPAGPFVRGLTIEVPDPTGVAEAFAILARAPRPWLERLRVAVADAGPPVADALVADVIAATPRLAMLDLGGAEAFARFPHPAVTTLALASPRLALAPSLPALRTLDLAIEAPDVDEDDEVYAPGVLHALTSLPDLRALDLARNEPSYPQRDPVGIYQLVRWLALDGIARLRLPSLRTPAQIALLSHAVELAPPTTHFEIARTYTLHAAALATIGHPRLALPAPFVWPPPDAMSSREALTITVPTEEYGDDVSLVQLALRLEAQFATLPPNASAAWLELWAFLADLPWEDDTGHEVTRPFPAATLLTALEALDDFQPFAGTAGPWAQLAEKLRAGDLPPEAAVSVRRYWGW